MGRTVLVAEDNGEVLDSIASALERLGMKVTRAETGAHLIRALVEQGPFDLLITDIRLPWMNGLQAGRSVRSAGLTMPILFITGLHDEKVEAEVRALDHASALLRKPFTIADLIASVLALMPPSSERGGTLLVRDVMRHAPVTVEAQDQVESVAERMARAGIHHFPVIHAGKLVGIISDRDLAVFRARHGQSARKKLASEAMRFPAPTVALGDSLATVARRMIAEETDGYAVVEGGELVGMVTTTDLLLAVGVEDPEGVPVETERSPRR
jgi:two-component system, cell cycle response regulator CpdR